MFGKKISLTLLLMLTQQSLVRKWFVENHQPVFSREKDCEEVEEEEEEVEEE
jgi:hypothetical protein